MKKILCLLCLAMMISLVGCGMSETKIETTEIADETPTEDTLTEESVGKAPASDTPAPSIQVSNKFGRAWSDVIYSESAELSKEDALALKAAIDTSRKIIPWEKILSAGIRTMRLLLMVFYMVIPVRELSIIMGETVLSA